MLKADWYNRRLSIDLAQLRNIDNVIALAAGKEKNQAVIGALRGRYVNTLIIDLTLAKSIQSIMTKL